MSAYSVVFGDDEELSFDRKSLRDLIDNDDLLKKVGKVFNIKDIEDFDSDDFVIIDEDSGYINDEKNILEYIDPRSERSLHIESSKENYSVASLEDYKVILINIDSDSFVIASLNDIDDIVDSCDRNDVPEFKGQREELEELDDGEEIELDDDEEEIELEGI